MSSIQQDGERPMSPWPTERPAMALVPDRVEIDGHWYPAIGLDAIRVSVSVIHTYWAKLEILLVDNPVEVGTEVAAILDDFALLVLVPTFVEGHRAQPVPLLTIPASLWRPALAA